MALEPGDQLAVGAAREHLGDEGAARPEHLASEREPGLDWTNSNAEARAIVIHNAWYAEPGVVAQHGKLGRSQGCFAFSREDQYPIMKRLAGGRMIYADKVA